MMKKGRKKIKGRIESKKRVHVWPSCFIALFVDFFLSLRYDSTLLIHCFGDDFSVEILTVSVSDSPPSPRKSAI